MVEDIKMPHTARKWLYHETPSWVKPEEEVFFITLCCKERNRHQLTLPKASEELIRSVQFKQTRQEWYFHCLLLMPDHLHGIISLPLDAKSLKVQLENWKRYTACNQKIVWQKGLFEHRLRSRQSRQEKFLYVLNNPVRAGLCATAEEWPHRWIP